MSLSADAAKPVVLNFFASWCDGCRQKFSTLSSAAKSSRGKVSLIGVDVNDVASQATEAIGRAGIRYPIGVDNGGNVAGEYRVMGLPTTVFLNRDHGVIGLVRSSDPAGSAAVVVPTHHQGKP